MNSRTRLVLATWAALLGGEAAAARADINLWPFYTERTRLDRAGESVTESQAIVPLFFSQPTAQAGRATGLRPLWLTLRDSDGRLRERHVAYPLFSLRRYEQGDRWSMLNLVRGEIPATDAAAPMSGSFELWPFYFSRDTGRPETSYRALFPMVGAVPGRLGHDRLSWVLFPLYGRAEKDGHLTTAAPWPFFRVFRGEEQRGFALWPLGGWREQAERFHERYFLWPLIHHRVDQLSVDGETRQRSHFLPFYSVERSPTLVSETWLWPFFGTLTRTEPTAYHARHYFWPLLVQGRGETRYVNRWAPIYTHSRNGPTEKTWLLWPLWREETWPGDGLDHTRRQLLFFLYHDTEQRRAPHPDLATARKVHVWPLVSTWDNGAGQRQVQALSPFAVFFPHQEIVRRLWSPLFALYRYDQPQPGDTRHALLWDAVTYERRDSTGVRDFRLGPLFGVRREPALHEVSLLGGLIGMRRAPGERAWRLFTGRGASDAAPGSASPPSP